MNDTVGIVAAGAQKPSKGIFHCPGSSCKYVCFDSRQMNNVFTNEAFGDQGF